MMRPFLRGFPVLGGLQLLALLCAAAAGAEILRGHAATLIVTTTADSGAGSLRAAIATASDGDTIEFDPSLIGQTITLTTGELLITKSITINGPGSNLLIITRDQQAPGFRLFHIQGTATVLIQGLTITGGYSIRGGGIYNENNAGTLTISDCVVTNNTAGPATPAPTGTPSPHGSGGGISTFVPIAQGTPRSGTTAILRSTISHNTAYSEGHGGGIDNVNSTVTITDSTISDNVGVYGAGIECELGPVRISNSTISNNSPPDGNGIWGSWIVQLTNSTLSNNWIESFGGIVELTSTILNSSPISNDSGNIQSHGYNISSDNGHGYLTGPGDQINTDPLLGPLQNNGGPTFTHALLDGSPAIDAGDPNFTPPPLYDQRDFGYLRVSNNRVDIGSFEVQPTGTISPTPTATATATFTPTATAKPTATSSATFTPTATATATTTGTPTPTPTPPCSPVISHSTSQAITTPAPFCAHHPPMVSPLPNYYWRAFDMQHFVQGAEYTTSSVSFGAYTSFSWPIVVQLFANDGAPFPAETGTLIGTGTALSGQGGTVVTIPLVATVPAGTRELVMELYTSAEEFFFPGANTAPETGASYWNGIKPGNCPTTPIPIDAHLVFNIYGTCTGPPLTPTPTPTATPTASPTATATATPTSTPGTCAAGSNWSTTATNPDTAPNCAFHDAPGCVTDSSLDTPVFMSGIGISTSFYFRHSYDFEENHDGGVLEISINGGPFIDIVTAGGGFPLNGYNGTIMTGTFSPIAGRPAWTGNSGGYINSYAALPPSAAFQNVRIRFRLATDCSGSGNGWRIDSIYASYPGGCTSPTPTATFGPTATATPTATPTATIDPCQPIVFAENFDGVTAPALPQGWVTSFDAGPANCTATATPAQLLNLSTRLLVQTGAHVGIGGFIITGSAPKDVLLRGIGPSLSAFGVPNALADPVLELHGPAGFTTVTNDNWRDTQAALIMATGLAPSNDLESAILVTLPPGNYTAILKGKNDTSGVGLVELYDLSQGVSQLANISTRAFVGTGGDVLIGGFILGGSLGANAHIVVRGLGPSLAAFGVPDPLPDPTLELRDSNGGLLTSSDTCSLPPPDPVEACVDISLPLGQYTAILAGRNGGTGVGLIEIYNLQ